MAIEYRHVGRSPEYNQQVRQAIDSQNQKLAEYKDAYRKGNKADLAKAKGELQAANKEVNDIVARSPKTHKDDRNPGRGNRPAFSAEVGKELMRQYEASRNQAEPTEATVARPANRISDADWMRLHPNGRIYTNSRGLQVGGGAGRVYDPEGTAYPLGQKDIDETWEEGMDAKLERIRSRKANAQARAERNKRIADQKIAEAVRKTYPSFEGQPTEATMIGTNNDAAPKIAKKALTRPFQTYGELLGVDKPAKDFKQIKEADLQVTDPRRLDAKALEEEAMNILEGAKLAEETPVNQEELRKEMADYYGPGGTLESESFDLDAAKQQDRERTARNYEAALRNGAMSDTTTTKSVRPDTIQPTKEEVENALVDEMVSKYVPDATSETTAPTAGTSGNYAVPTTAERQAWADKKYTDATLMSQALEDAANATNDPNQKALYMMAAERAREWEGWQNEENAYRRSQAQAAREMRERLRSAAQRRDQREYNDQDPSWADSLRKVPMVQNLIGVRRYNPETGEMEWHYPRNAAEGVGALLTSLPQIAHATLTGDNRLQREYRAMEQNQMYAPYKMDYADMEDYRRGAMVQPTPTWSDRMAANIGENSFGSLKEQQRLQGVEATTEYIRNRFGDEMANGYLKAQLGIKDPAGTMSLEEANQAIATATYLETDPLASPEEKAMSRVALIGVLSNTKLPQELRNEAARLLGKGRSQKLIENGVSETPVSDETSAGIAKDVRKVQARNLTGKTIDELREKYPAVDKQTKEILAGYHNILASDGEDAAKKYLEKTVKDSVLLKNANAGRWNDVGVRFSETVAGAGLGFAAGAPFGGVGAAVGAGIGALIGLIGPDATASILRINGAEGAAKAVEKWALPKTNAELVPVLKAAYKKYLLDLINKGQVEEATTDAVAEAIQKSKEEPVINTSNP